MGSLGCQYLIKSRSYRIRSHSDIDRLVKRMIDVNVLFK